MHVTAPRVALHVLLCLAALVGSASPARAADTTIDFDAAVSVGNLVSTQYAAQGLTFVSNLDAYAITHGVSCGLPAVTAVPATAEHSGTQAVAIQGCGGEIGIPLATYGVFSMLRSHARVYFYDDQVCAMCDPTYYLRAYDIDGNLVAFENFPHIASLHWLYLEVITAQPQIAFFALGTYHAVSDFLVDDLSFDNPPGQPDFKLNFNSAPRVYPGSSADLPVTVTRFNGSHGPIDLSVSNLPTGVSATFTPTPITGADTTATLHLSIDPNAPSVANRAFSVTATPGTIGAGTTTRQLTQTITITTPFAFEALPKPMVAPCSPVTVTVPISTDSFFQGALTFAAISGSPALAAQAGQIRTIDPTHRAVEVTLSPQNGFTIGATYNVGLALSAAALPDASALLAVATEAGDIATVSPTRMSTPQLGSPGSLVTLVGHGLCSDVRVSVGNPNAGVAPTAVAADGSSLTFRVPRAATSGQVTVTRKDGQSFAGASVRVLGFRNLAGFSWPNGDYKTGISGDDIDELFGPAETNIDISGWLIRKPEATLFERAVNNHIPGGICFGMVYGALEFFLAPNERTLFPYSAGEQAAFAPYAPGSWSLDGPPRPSNPLLHFAIARFSLQFTDQLIPIEVNQLLGQAFGAHPADEDITEIRTELNSGYPAIIGLIHWEGISLRAHTVLAYDIEDLANGTTAVLVYNPNIPYRVGEESDPNAHGSAEFTNSRIIIDAGGHWTFEQLTANDGTPWNGPDANLIVYPHEKLPIINGQRPKLPNLFTAAVVAVFGSSGDQVTQVSDDAGHALVANGTIATPTRWPSGVAPLVSATGAAQPLQMVAAAGTSGPLHATVRRGAGGGAMNATLPGLLASMQVDARPGQVDRVSIDPRRSTIDYAPGGRATPFDASLIASPAASNLTRHGAGRARAGTGRVVRLQTTIGRGAAEQFGFPSGQAFVLRQRGAAGPVRIELSALATDGRPVAIALPTLHLAAGETVRVEPEDWSRLSTTRFRLTSANRGRRRVTLLRGRTLGRAFASLRSIAVGLDVRGRSTITMRLRLRRSPAGGWLSPVVTVFHGRRVVARSAPSQFAAGDPTAGQVALTLALGRRLPRGRYTARIRILEAGGGDIGQGSVVVAATRRLAVRR